MNHARKLSIKMIFLTIRFEFNSGSQAQSNDKLDSVDRLTKNQRQLSLRLQNAAVRLNYSQNMKVIQIVLLIAIFVTTSCLSMVQRVQNLEKTIEELQQIVHKWEIDIETCKAKNQVIDNLSLSFNQSTLQNNVNLKNINKALKTLSKAQTDLSRSLQNVNGSCQQLNITTQLLNMSILEQNQTAQAFTSATNERAKNQEVRVRDYIKAGIRIGDRWFLSQETIHFVVRDLITTAAGRDSRYAMYAGRYRDP